MVDILAETAQRAKLEGERIGKERSEYAAAVKLLRLGTPMETIEKVFTDFSPEDLKRALDESKLSQ